MSRIVPCLLVTVFLAGATPRTARADGPYRIDSYFNFRWDIYINSDNNLPRPTAPWYLYFPSDPRMQMPPTASRFPTWPQQWPPVNGTVPATPVSNNIGWYTPSYYPYVQQVGYNAGYGYPQGVPSYWYPR